MKINMCLIAHNLCFPAESNPGSPFRDAEIEYCFIWSEGIPIRNNVVYILDGREYPIIRNIRRKKNLILIGRPTAPVDQTDQTIIVPGYLTKEVVYYQTRKIFRRYEVYETQLSQPSAAKNMAVSLDRLLPVIFPMPVLILGTFREVLYLQKTGKETMDITFLKEDDSDFLKAEYEDIFFSKECDENGFSFGTTDEQLPFLMYRSSKGRLSTAIILLDVFHQLNDGFYLPLRHLGDFLEKIFTKTLADRYRYLPMFRKKLEHHLLQPDADSSKKQYLTYVLSKIGWSESDSFVCAAIQPEIDFPENSFTVTSPSLFSEHGIALRAEENIYLFNLTHAKITFGQIEEHLLSSLRRQLCVAGISSPFNDFLQYPVFTIQAKAALEMGRRLNIQKNIFFYREYLCDYLIRYGIYSLPMEAILPEALKKMIAYDGKRHTHYYATLATLLKHDFRKKESADELKIHINTLSFRLRKIQEFLETDTDSPEERLLLSMISCLFPPEEWNHNSSLRLIFPKPAAGCQEPTKTV